MHPLMRSNLEYGYSGDVWADTMGAWFDIADVLYVSGNDIPAHWEYNQPWPSETVESTMFDPDQGSVFAQTTMLDLRDGSLTADDLRQAGDVLERYSRILKAQGRSY